MSVRTGVFLDPHRFAVDAGFSPLSIPWDAAYWAGGPNFAAQGYSNGATVSVWPDESPNGNNLNQSSSGNFPTFVSSSVDFNSRPVVDFTSTQRISIPALHANLVQPGESCLVVRADLTNNTRPVVSGTGANGWCIRCFGNTYSLVADTNFATGVNWVTTPHYLRAVWDTSDVLFRDGTQIASGNAGAADKTAMQLGGIGNANFDGRIAFYGVIDRLLTTQERADMLAWSQSHYGTP